MADIKSEIEDSVETARDAVADSVDSARKRFQKLGDQAQKLGDQTKDARPTPMHSTTPSLPTAHEPGNGRYQCSRRGLKSNEFSV